MKVLLVSGACLSDYCRRQGVTKLAVTRALPFYQKTPCNLVHRIRSITLIYRDGAFSHSCVGFYCGNGGFCGGRHETARIIESPSACARHCSFCEAKIKRANLHSSEKLAGHPVQFHKNTR